MHFDWIEAGERAQQTVRLLSEQLRRFLDDQVWLDNRRVFELLRKIEGHALALRDQAGTADRLPGMTIDAVAPEVVLPFERPLYTPRQQSMINSAEVVDGEADFEATALYDQTYVDLAELDRVVRAGLLDHEQVGLTELVAAHPLEHGLADLVGYLSLTDPAYA